MKRFLFLLHITLFFFVAYVNSLRTNSPFKQITRGHSTSLMATAISDPELAPKKYDRPTRNNLARWVADKFTDFISTSPLKPLIISAAAVVTTVLLFELAKVAILFGLPLYFTVEFLRASARAPKFIDTTLIKTEIESSTALKSQLDTYNEKLQRRNEILNEITITSSQSQLKAFDERMADRKYKVFMLNKELKKMKSNIAPLQASLEELQTRVDNQLNNISQKKREIDASNDLIEKNIPDLNSDVEPEYLMSQDLESGSNSNM